MYLRILEKGLLLKTIALLVFEKLAYKRIVDHLDKCGIFLISSMVFRSTADLLTFVSDRIARVFNRSGAFRAVALDIQGFQQGLACQSTSKTYWSYSFPTIH